MNIYLDTSTLAKKYVKEPGLSELIRLWKDSTALFTSAVTYAEMMASFHRKQRKVTLPEKTFRRMIASFRRDWQGLFRVEVSERLHDSIDRLVSEYTLRGFDAIHLSSAILMHDRLRQDFVFARSDQQLLQAARREGLATFPAA